MNRKKQQGSVPVRYARVLWAVTKRSRFCLGTTGKSNCIKKNRDVSARDARYLKPRDFHMSITAPEELKPTSSSPDKSWKCCVCGYIHTGKKPPKECPECASTEREFEEINDKKETQV